MLKSWHQMCTSHVIKYQQHLRICTHHCYCMTVYVVSVPFFLQTNNNSQFRIPLAEVELRNFIYYLFLYSLVHGLKIQIINEERLNIFNQSWLYHIINSYTLHPIWIKLLWVIVRTFMKFFRKNNRSVEGLN